MSLTRSEVLAHPATEPLPVLARRPTLRDTFVSLRVPNYRWYIASLVPSQAGAWLARLAADWLIIELTGNVGLVSLVVAAQLLPPMLLGAWGGLLGDRFSARRTVLGVHGLLVVAILMLAIPTIFGAHSVPLILATSLMIGLSAAFEAPSRAVLVVQVVGTRRLSNALSLNAAVVQLSGIVGASLAGFLILWIGVGWTLIAAAAGPLIGIALLFRIRARQLHPATKIAREPGQVVEALRYVARKPELRLALLLIFSLAVFGMTGSVLYAWAAQEKFDMGPVGYSTFQATAAVGAFLGSLLSARRRSLTLRDNALLLALTGTIWAFIGFAPAVAVFSAALIAVFIVRLMFIIGNDSFTQLSANGAIRARVVSLYMITATGGQALGALLTGWMVNAFGGELTFVITGAVPAIVALAVWATVARQARRENASGCRTPARRLTTGAP